MKNKGCLGPILLFLLGVMPWLVIIFYYSIALSGSLISESTGIKLQNSFLSSLLLNCLLLGLLLFGIIGWIWVIYRLLKKHFQI
jgi:hypothetical protein